MLSLNICVGKWRIFPTQCFFGAHSWRKQQAGLLLYSGSNARDVASNCSADQVLYFDHEALAEFTSDAYQKVLAELISKDQPRAVLFGNTSIGADVASVLSMRLDLPLVGSCRNFTKDGKFVSQICGGKIMAEGDLPGPMALVTLVPGGYQPDQGRSTEAPPITEATVPGLDPLRVSLSKYIEPETSDVDISKEPLLIAVGRGIQNKDNIELAENLHRWWVAAQPVIDRGHIHRALWANLQACQTEDLFCIRHQRRPGACGGNH
jgi:electron transfer flavoprotein alpha subunit